jgi:hypothetical protein
MTRIQILSALFLLALLSFTRIIFATDDQEAKELDTVVDVVVTMQNHGYTLGDLVVMRAEFTLRKNLIFDKNSVPLAGPITRWLDLRDVHLHQSKSEGRTHIKIDFAWQIFGTVNEAQKIKIPAIILHANSNKTAVVDENGKTRPSIITIPEQGFYLSPVLPEKLTDEESPRPIILPPRFDETTAMLMTFICLGLGVFLGGFYLWWQDKLIFLPRHPGAMTLLARQFRQQNVVKQAQFSAENLRTIHAGLAAAAEQSLYPNTLVNLFKHAAYLRGDRQEIEQFFNTSWQQFHSQNSAENTISVADTILWIKRAAIAERLYSREKPSRYFKDNATK